MATAAISSTFDIVITGAADLNVAKSFTVPRACTVVRCSVFNADAATATLVMSGSIAGTFTATTGTPPAAGAAIIGSNATGAGGEPTQNVAIFAANAGLKSGEVITVVASAPTISQIVLQCVAEGRGQAITVS